MRHFRKPLHILKDQRIEEYKDGSPSAESCMFHIAMEAAKKSGLTYEQSRSILEAIIQMILEAWQRDTTVNLKLFGTLELKETLEWKTVNQEDPLITRNLEVEFIPSQSLDSEFLEASKRVVQRELIRQISNYKRINKDLRNDSKHRYKVVLRTVGKCHEEPPTD